MAKGDNPIFEAATELVVAYLGAVGDLKLPEQQTRDADPEWRKDAFRELFTELYEAAHDAASAAAFKERGGFVRLFDGKEYNLGGIGGAEIESLAAEAAKQGGKKS